MSLHIALSSPPLTIYSQFHFPFLHSLVVIFISPLSLLQLIGQYLALRSSSKNDEFDPDTVGLISSKASPYLIAQQVSVCGDVCEWICGGSSGDARMCSAAM